MLNNSIFLPINTLNLTIKNKKSRNFINRISTKNITKLNQKKNTAFLSKKGKTIQLTQIVSFKKSKIILLSLLNVNHIFFPWLKRYTFLEHLSIKINQNCSFWICGKNAKIITIKLHLTINKNTISFQTFNYINQLNNINKSFIANNNKNKKKYIYKTIKTKTYLITTEEHKSITIASGVPTNFEVKNNNLLTLNLIKFLSWNKGCYSGQEVISRLYTNYQNIYKIFNIHINQTTWKLIKPNQKIICNGKNIGKITSIAKKYYPNKCSSFIKIRIKRNNNDNLNCFIQINKNVTKSILINQKLFHLI